MKMMFSFTCKLNSFSYERMGTKTRFEKEAKGNSEMVYFVGRYIEMPMCRVYLSMRNEGIKAFSKRIRRCSVDRRKRYENGTCGRKSF